MTQDMKDMKYRQACIKLVGLAADGVNIHGMALELKMAYRLASDTRFQETLAMIDEAYEHA